MSIIIVNCFKLQEFIILFACYELVRNDTNAFLFQILESRMNSEHFHGTVPWHSSNLIKEAVRNFTCLLENDIQGDISSLITCDKNCDSGSSVFTDLQLRNSSKTTGSICNIKEVTNNYIL